MRRDTEHGVTPPQAKERLGPKKLEEAREESPLKPLEGLQPC